MNRPTEAGPVGRGIRITVAKYDEEFIPPDDSSPARVTARVIVNGLLAGKATVPIDGWNHLSEEEAAAEAIGYAWGLATRRMDQWRKGLARWDAL